MKDVRLRKGGDDLIPLRIDSRVYVFLDEAHFSGTFTGILRYLRLPGLIRLTGLLVRVISTALKQGRFNDLSAGFVLILSHGKETP